MTNILFICLGNICRSPMAEFVFKDMVKKLGRSDEFYIASAATSYEEIGNPVHYGTARVLDRLKISYAEKRATHLEKSDYEKYDYFLCMDRNNIRNALWILGDDPQNKLELLMSYTGHARDVSDPWYSRNFTTAFNDIFEGCESFLKKISAK